MIIPLYAHVLRGLPSWSLLQLMRSGSSEAPSDDTASDDDGDATAIGVWTDGRYVIGEEGGDAGEWISADEPIPREQSR